MSEFDNSFIATQQGKKMAKALVRVKPSRRPNSGEFIGFRLEAAVPNMQGRKMRVTEVGGSIEFRATKDAAPSFRGPYLIEQGSDEVEITRDRVTQFCSRLKFSGYTEFEYLGEELNSLMG
jgi:hypothetical protein